MEVAHSDSGGVISVPAPPPKQGFALFVNGNLPLCHEFKQAVQLADPETDMFEWEDETLSVNHVIRLTLSNMRQTILELHFAGRLSAGLTHLNLSFNRLVDLSAISLLQQLQCLDIAHNKAISLDAVRGLTKLRTLRCHHNIIETLEPLVGLLKLEELWVSENEIQWGEFIFLEPLLHLSSLCKAGNPADSKPRMNDFVQALRPSLCYIEAVDITADYDEHSSSDFLRSTDGKVMLAQSQAALSKSQRQVLQDSEGGALRLAAEYHTDKGQYGPSHSVHSHNIHNANTHFKRGRVLRHGRADSDGSASPTRPSHNTHLHAQGQGQGQGQGGNIIISAALNKPSGFEIKSSGYGQHRTRSHSPKDGMRSHPNRARQRVQHYQARRDLGRPPEVVVPKKWDQVPKFGSPQYDRGLGGDGGVGPRTPIIGGGGGPQLAPLDLGGNLGGHGRTEEREAPYSSPAATSGSPLHRSGQLPPVKVLRYKAENYRTEEEAAVALCLFANGDGYAQWDSMSSHNSYTRAVSLEQGSLFSSYKNGDIAVTLDAEGNGSVMDSKGRVLLLLTSGKKKVGGLGVAVVSDPKSGRVLHEYSKPADGAGLPNIALSPRAGGEGPAADVHGTNSNHSGASATARKKPHSWKLSPGLIVQFIPSTWELLLQFSNKRLSCEFSSLTGGKLLQDKGIAAELSERAGNTPLDVDKELAEAEAEEGDDDQNESREGTASAGGGEYNPRSFPVGYNNKAGGIGNSNRRDRGKRYNKDRGWRTNSDKWKPVGGNGGGKEGGKGDNGRAQGHESIPSSGYGQKFTREKHRKQKKDDHLKSRLTTEDHTNLRRDVSDIMGNLDSLLSGLQDKKQ